MVSYLSSNSGLANEKKAASESKPLSRVRKVVLYGCYRLLFAIEKEREKPGMKL